MGTTDGNGVYTPDLDEEGWDDEIADNFTLFSQNITDTAAHIVDTTAAHAASAVSFSPTGTVAATTVQTAIAEVASEAAQASALATVATSGSASDLGTGTLPIARIADGAVTLAKQANMATARIRGRVTAGTGVPEDLTAAQAVSVIAPSLPGVGALSADVATSETTTTTTYTDLATVGPSVSPTIGPSGMALVFVFAQMSNNTVSNGARMSVSIAGSTAVDADGAVVSNPSLTGANSIVVGSSKMTLATGLTPGTVAFVSKYRASVGGTATFVNRRIVVVPL